MSTLLLHYETDLFVCACGKTACSVRPSTLRDSLETHGFTCTTCTILQKRAGAIDAILRHAAH